jgi:pimeloyl-ACP methyl ester carboxylesterase
VDSHVNLLVSTRRISASISGQLAIMSSLMAFRGSSWRPAMFRELKSRNPDLRIIANDSGGAVAQLFVTRYQERVRTLLLTNCDVERDSPPAAVLPVIEHARAGTFADLWLAPWVADKALARSPKGLGGIACTYPSQLSDETIDFYLGPHVSSPQRKALVNAYAIAVDPNPLASSLRSGGARCQPASYGKRVTTSCRKQALTIWIVHSPTPEVCGVCRKRNCSSPKRCRS